MARSSSANGSSELLPRPAEGRFLLRALIAAIVVVGAIGAFVATATLLEVGKIAKAFRQNKTINVGPQVLTQAAAGAPETLLLVGDDRRPAPKGKPDAFVVPHSNEMLLVRLDPSKPTIAMLSIPRELKVTIYPHGARPYVGRINAAYTIGGIQLMTETIKRVIGVSINHVVVITFPHFKRAVDEMGCVYTTVDRRYYHSNVGSAQQYFEIDLQPGYQRLCGEQALQFVAYRHGDTSLVRDARDQRFLLDVKAQYGPTLLDNRDKFEQLFGRAVETDIHGVSQILSLAELLAQMAGRPVRQVHFDVNIGPSFDTATPEQINLAVNAFLHGVGKAAHRRVSAAVRGAQRGGAARGAGPGLSLTHTSSADLANARAAAVGMPFALEYPRVRNQPGGAAPDRLRNYMLYDEQGKPHDAYAVVIDRGTLGDFYNVQGTTWQDPPLLRNPSQTVQIGSRTYGLYYQGDNLRLVAWREGPAVYWISNTLTDAVPPAEMVAMAVQTTPVTGSGALSQGVTRPRKFVLPKRRAATAVGTVQTVGAGLGLVAFAGILALAVLWVRRRRSLRELRAHLEALARDEVQLRRRLAAAAGVPAPAPPAPAPPAPAPRVPAPRVPAPASRARASDT
jgi:LCP family protein required for cell wall assembly